MLKFLRILFFNVLLFFTFSIIFSIVSSKPKTASESKNIMIISSPDQGLKALSKIIDKNKWTKYFDKAATIRSSDNYQVCLTIGKRAANALLSVYMNDFDTAENIGKSIKEAADSLNIKSKKVELAMKILVEDLKEPEGKEKNQRVKKSINLLTDEINNAFKELGSEDYALLIQFGTWSEGLRQFTGIVKDEYSEEAAELLNRKGEAKFFAEGFTELNKKNRKTLYADAAKTARQVYDSMNKKVITFNDVQTMHKVLTDFVTTYTK